jgi:acyl-CoA reductase-like NAD-dependent aldehyde dehydrogenase
MAIRRQETTMTTDAMRALPIGEERVTTGDDIRVLAPYDGTELGRVPRCDATHVDRAVEAARKVMADPMPAWRRAEILDEAARRLADPATADRFARTLAQEAAKPITTARVEVSRAASTFAFSAAEARKVAGEMVPLDASPAGEGKLGFVLRVPIGVVGAISPFNFPLNLVAHKVAPAIAAGCPVVLKPASQTPLSAIGLAELLLDECGLPAGWLSVVTGGGRDVGDAIVTHDDVAMITFTGSPEVGWSIRAKAPRKKVGLELGNNAPVVVEPDGDWEGAARKISVHGYSHAGQSCISVQRVLVHESIAREFSDTLSGHVEALRIGDPLDEDTQVSALISAGERDRVHAWIGEAVDGGAAVLAGGEIRDQLLLPTVLSGVSGDMKVCTEEVFGPVVGIQTYDRFDDALAMANDTKYGLQAAVFTADVGKALQAVRTLDFGGVLVNEVPTWRADQMPYGGLRDSGNTREGPAYAVEDMTERRMVVLQG